MEYRKTLISVFVLFVIITLLNNANEKNILKKQALKEKDWATLSFAEMTLNAKAAYVYDLGRGKVLYEKNADEILPLASLAKLMTAYVALKEAPRGTFITINKESIKEEGDTGLYPGEKWILKKLVEFTLTTSSNDGAAAIARTFNEQKEATTTKENFFVNKMNQEAAALELLNTHFSNETGLDEPNSVPGAYGSAKDITMLLSQFLKKYPELLEATAHALNTINSENKPHNIENTNKEAAKIPGLMASKTGFTDLAGGNLIIAFDAGIGQPIIVTVLGSTREGRFSDAEELILRTREAILRGL